MLTEREQWTRKYHRATQRSEAQEEELEHLETELARWKAKARDYQNMAVKEVVRPKPGTSNQGEVMIGLYEELAQAKAQELQHQEAWDKLIAELQVSAIQVQGLQEQVAKLKEEIKDSEQFVADTVLQSQNAAFQEDRALKVVEKAQQDKAEALQQRDAVQRTLHQNNTTLSLINTELKGKTESFRILQLEVRRSRQQLEELRNPT